ncbi:type II toxin-antitoxin system VapC family toxin [Caenispirillum bisanense]|uniref:Ribonuclease VapC n=1 Tax=Caenispirillum bisanense TaxID=414052 RepID=A0A286G6F1_9PROT|nr:type II toxin-antitoxin system VapC family toxin [Caenispirillum bisanense]SOD91088.1 hypothetical protein SAMN05421508_101803 [Caenispirillum bisanense]
MSLYLDTSLLVAALTKEAATERVQAWLAAQEAEHLVLGEWAVTEFSSALSLKLRTGQLDEDLRSSALATFKRLAAETFRILPVEPVHFRLAARFADDHRLGLRAGDALHLAIVAEHGGTLCTLDRRFAAAASSLGIETVFL